MAETIILSILACFAVTYGGYPLLVLILAKARRSAPASPQLGQAPRSVSIVICAHNEAATIGRKLQSVLSSVAGRGERIEIIVVDDGSTDGSGDIVEGLAALSPLPIRPIRQPRGGKAAALRRAILAAEGEILVFSDADPVWDGWTFTALLAPFADPRIGAVAGEVRTLRGSGANSLRGGDTLFRAYESAIRTAEDRLFGCVSADGGLFALRASLAGPVPPDVTDDFYLSTAAVARGLRIAFRPDAVVWEASPTAQHEHFRRRIRITVRGLTGLWRRRALLNPFRTGPYALGLLFHKVLRRLVPLLLLPLWGAALSLSLEGAGGVYLATFGLLSIAAAWTALLLLVPLPVPRLLRLPLYVSLHIGGLAVGTLLFLTGKRYTQWAPQQR